MTIRERQLRRSAGYTAGVVAGLLDACNATRFPPSNVEGHRAHLALVDRLREAEAAAEAAALALADYRAP